MTGKKKHSVRPKPKVNTYADIKKRQKEQKEQKKAQAPAQVRDARDEQDPKRPVSDGDQKHQQRVLDVFRRAFDHVLSSPHLTTTLQSVKQALYDRDFARAFGDAEHLDVYAARWSPTRALCYASVLAGIEEHLGPLLSNGDGGEGDENTSADEHPEPQRFKVLSIGGSAAELAAMASFLSQHDPPLSSSITLVDSGPWDAVVSKLTAALTTPPPISKYASEATKLSNTALVSASHLSPTFLQRDVFTLDKPELAALAGPAPLLITILFTLNELFTAGGVGKTTTFLMNLTAAAPAGSLLLVVDSPGSYSETSVGREAKRYPMHWLLDQIAVATTRRAPVDGRRWAKVETRESVWFRLPADAPLDYPIPLENMRYQLHLYRAEDAAPDGEA